MDILFGIYVSNKAKTIWYSICQNVEFKVPQDIPPKRKTVEKQVLIKLRLGVG